MQVLPAHLLYLMHMHYTFGTHDHDSAGNIKWATACKFHFLCFFYFFFLGAFQNFFESETQGGYRVEIFRAKNRNSLVQVFTLTMFNLNSQVVFSLFFFFTATLLYFGSLYSSTYHGSQKFPLSTAM